jgi:catechol 2,3-dioxygenase-like lactoylglutathione lyase family enzyme
VATFALPLTAVLALHASAATVGLLAAAGSFPLAAWCRPGSPGGSGSGLRSSWRSPAGPPACCSCCLHLFLGCVSCRTQPSEEFTFSHAYGSGTDWFAYRPARGKGTQLFFYAAQENGGHARQRPGLQHLSFYVSKQADVRAAYAWVRERGDEVLEEPQPFPQYHADCYAFFWLDPHGFKLEVCCFEHAE